MNTAFERDGEHGKEEWLTPPEIIRALGEFDLDPCAPVRRPWDTARQHYTILDNGLLKAWSGRVWLNPPYGNQTGRWLARAVEHRNVTALIFARTETSHFFDYIWPEATALVFLRGRLRFWELQCMQCGLGVSARIHASDHKPVLDGRAVQGGTAGAPSVLVAWDEPNAAHLRNAIAQGLLAGCYVNLHNRFCS